MGKLIVVDFKAEKALRAKKRRQQSKKIEACVSQILRVSTKLLDILYSEENEPSSPEHENPLN